MKIFGLHWAGHSLYLVALAGLVFLGKNRLNQTAFLKNELGEVQQLTLSEVKQFGQSSLSEIDELTKAYPSPQHEQICSTAKQAATLVRAFNDKSREACERLRNGAQPDQINWRTDLLDDFYRLGDSLSAIYGSDSAQQVWLERCLFSSYRTFPPEQLASMLAASDTADASRLCRNLHLKAELALLFVLENLRKKVRTFEMRFDGLMPVLAPLDCPRAGAPFKAEIFLASYSNSAENLSMKVNGKPIPVKAGLSHYATIFKRPGKQKLMVEIQVRNPLTLEIKTYRKEFITWVSAAQELR